MPALRRSLPLLPLVVALVMPARAQFETRGTYQTLQSPVSIAVGDFNHDGNLDIAVACYFLSQQVSVLLGNPDGTFQPPVNYDAGAEPSSVAVGDFNNDGNLDLAVADDASTNDVSILLGNGNGTFQAPITYTTPHPPTSYVGVGDFNNDHNLDLVLVESHHFDIMLGNGDGTFQPPLAFATAYAPTSVGIGDFNRDGKLDLAVGEQFGGLSQVQIFLGKGDGTFRAGASYAVGSQPTSLTAADLRADGKLDLVVSSFGDGLDVLLGNGDGTFQGSVRYAGGTTWATVADLNGDGIPDIVSVSFDFPSGVFVSLGNGKGTFGSPAYYPDGKQTEFVATGDFNHDHMTDLVVADAYFKDNDVIVMLNTGVANFSPTTPLNFKDQAVGTTSAPQTVVLTNTGTGPLKISAMKVTGAFRMSSTCGTSVAAGGSCQISATFSPKAKGSQQGTVLIDDGASSKPQVIELFGTGT